MNRYPGYGGYDDEREEDDDPRGYDRPRGADRSRGFDRSRGSDQPWEGERSRDRNRPGDRGRPRGYGDAPSRGYGPSRGYEGPRRGREPAWGGDEPERSPGPGGYGRPGDYGGPSRPPRGYAGPPPGYGPPPGGYGGPPGGHAGPFSAQERPRGYAQRPASAALAMQPPTRKRSRKGLWIALGVIAGLLVVCGAGGVGLFAYAVAQAARPLQVATAFCADLKTQEYSSAYTLLSKAYQAQVTEAAYVQTAQLHDQVDGTVQSCGLQTADSGGFTFDFNRNTATVAAQIVRKTAVSGTIALVEEASMWKIARLDASLQGTDVGPLATANDFCHALASANYAASWRDFSSRYQSKNPEATYVSRIKQAIAAASQQAGGTVKYDGCKHDLSTYQVAADDASASLSSALIVQDAAQSVELPIKLAFIMEASSWKIDSITNATA